MKIGEDLRRIGARWEVNNGLMIRTENSLIKDNTISLIAAQRCQVIDEKRGRLVTYLNVKKFPKAPRTKVKLFYSDKEVHKSLKFKSYYTGCCAALKQTEPKTSSWQPIAGICRLVFLSQVDFYQYLLLLFIPAFHVTLSSLFIKI